VSKYNSPIFVLSAISEFFNSTVREQLDIDTDQHENVLFVNMVEIKSIFQIHQFENYFPDFFIEYEYQSAKSYSLTITTKKSLHLLFNYVNLLMIFIALSGDDFVYLDQGAIEKYLSSIERLDAPFFIRYLFSRNLFRNRKQFEMYRTRLETTDRYKSIRLEFGNTSIQRLNHIKQIISFDKPIVDIGCGEGFYAIPFAQKSNNTQYYAIDIKTSATASIEQKAEKKSITNISVYNHINTFLNHYDGECVDVLLTEVIEHMPLDESKSFIKKIIKKINFDKFIITVPNRDFNQFYMLDGGFRHTDHKWEPTEQEFQQLINALVPNGFNIEMISIGDTVDGISTSTGCVISKVLK
jgi:SAM-dependent methyltransferase